MILDKGNEVGEVRNEEVTENGSDTDCSRGYHERREQARGGKQAVGNQWCRGRLSGERILRTTSREGEFLNA